MLLRIALPVCFFVVGCSQKGNQGSAPPFADFGGVKRERTTPPAPIEIVAPARGALFRSGEPIRCVFRVLAERQAQIPSLLHAKLMRGDVHHEMHYPTPVAEPDKDGFEYRAEFAAPPQPGTYTIRVDGTDWIESGEDEGELPPTFPAGSAEVSIEVTRP